MAGGSGSRRRRWALGLGVLLALMTGLAANAGGFDTESAPSAIAVPTAYPGVTYYVSPAGSDSNSGTSPSQSWRTVQRVNSAALAPGDAVLFQGGATFSDNTLMPSVSGAGNDPIVYGSYGSGQATLTQGVWFPSENYLTFDNLKLGTQQGLQGGNNSGRTANHIVIQGCTIELSASNPRVGIYSNGNDWTIAGNTIQDIGNSGMLLNGDTYTVAGNTIDHVGLDPAITWAKHGIYLMASNATITQNRITNFQTAGISPRFRDSTITHNYISGGQIGIAFYQYDPIAGTSRWTDNSIINTTDAGVYVNGGSGDRHPTQENFNIENNTIQPSTGQIMNLEHTSGSYDFGRADSAPRLGAGAARRPHTAGRTHSVKVAAPGP